MKGFIDFSWGSYLSHNTFQCLVAQRITDHNLELMILPEGAQ
jgi:hypothetical protein